MAAYDEEVGIPVIPDVGTSSVEEVLEALKAWVEIRQGDGGDERDRAITLRDLMNSGMVPPDVDFFSKLGDAPDIPSDVVDASVPPTPTHFTAAGAVNNIILTWVFPVTYTRLSHFELWRGVEDNLATAVIHAKPKQTVFADDVGAGATYYYWVRAVSDGGVSPYSRLQGVKGSTAIDTSEVIDIIGDQIDVSGLLDQLTIKEDVGGNVYGYGPVKIDADNPVRAFMILADRFIVSGGAQHGIAPRPAFFVQTQDTVVNGVVAPAGAYMDGAFIRNGTITNLMVGAAAIDDAKIANVSAAKVTFGEMSGDRIQVDTLNANRISTDTLSVKMASLTNAYVQSGNIVSLAVTTAKIADAAVSTAKIANLAVTNATIANLAVTEGKIANLAITNAKIANTAITEAKIANAAITEAKIANAAITAAKIRDAQITNAKIVNAAVDTLKIAGNSVTITSSATGPYVASTGTSLSTTRDITLTFHAPVASAVVIDVNLFYASGSPELTPSAATQIIRNGSLVRSFAIRDSARIIYNAAAGTNTFVMRQPSYIVGPALAQRFPETSFVLFVTMR